MDAIGLNPIKLDAIGLDPIRMNAIRLGVPVASSGSGRPYIDPELLSHVKMAISTWGKTNDDPDRAVLKDLSGNGNDMRLLNFGFAENSGYGLYSTDFTKWTKRQINDLEVSPNKISASNKDSETALVIWLDVNKNRYVIPSYKIKVSKLTKTITYYYIDEANPSIRSTFSINKEGTYILPISRNDLYNGEENTNIGFGIFPHESFTIEQLPDFEGWLCTDGVDDIIESVKPVSEMLEGSSEITVVSIIHQIKINDSATVTNDIRNTNIASTSRNAVKVDGKTGIYGYSRKGTDDCVLINNILGDKTDYTVTSGSTVNYNNLFSVVGTQYGDYNSQIAYAGGFIANKSLTTDEINQIIAYFNLDRPGQIIKPQLYCNIKRQGITNDNHAEFNDQLIDFINGYNIQLNNISWEKQSGIGNYPISFKDYTYLPTRATVEVNKDNFIIKANTDNNNFLEINTKSKSLPNYKVKVQGINTIVNGTLYYKVNDGSTIHYTEILEDGEYEIPESSLTEISKYSGWAIIGGFNDNVNVKVTVLPKEGSEYALYLDGISDFGKATGLPILKDYMVVADRKIIGNNNGGILSKSYARDNGAFIFETGSVNYSFGTGTSGSGIQSKRMLSYLSKYIYNGNPVQAGASVDSDTMWIGTVRDGDTRFSNLALWSLMLFPYSLSEFLLERQLKKYKAGTLYPDMIEFRPIVKSNVPYSSISYSVNPGVYVTEGSAVTITITLENASDKLVGVSSNAISDISISGDNGVYEVTGKVTKSPQKISIVISSYLTMLGNDTLISNETLIKNE
ncbi:hypothetical protein KSY24_05465 [Bacteroides thetaiotaomicron]|uniref:hypothetical protein n=1 Tax=Bacteroides thetaiotaomicron TaxID=818 RepID=UPI001C3799A2|nr:hypothetical protein [Bacteroides thetaiotaomicron]MBV3853183.1 hypothetical protein [Bacteroides thetaiotaomicron]MBV3926329.1 hypothetical protein [Bacteroides thetaiotaomicron]MBV3930390.1 hypothetical protein [Bacteroides thetaiotaomicron]MBV3939444.1 hypothetical protein [Bacteroides thetaiotaomicron]MBV3953767.1 hypothetical protein [Bacteroides thetaiotaomicron]